MTDADIIDGIIIAEGSEFTDHPADKGGPTRYGITQATLSDWLGRPATVQDVQNLTEPAARLIYQKKYIKEPGFWKITNDRLRVLVIDFGVNSGPETATRKLQFVVGAKPDGILGPLTLAAIEKIGADEARKRLLAARMEFLMDLALKEPVTRVFIRTNQRLQITFLRGWINRCLKFI